MNQEKIGKFIAENRKLKNLTQVELAEKLGVSDRSISKWENGRGMPDLSLFEPLCQELNISINELLSGEKLNRDRYQEKFEKNILNTIDYSNKKIKKTRNKIIIIWSVIGIIIISLIIMLFIDVIRMNNNMPVIFSTWGFNYTAPINLQEEYLNFAISDYLTEINNEENKHHEKEKWFVSFRTYLIEEKNKSLYYVYAWVLEENYYLENDELKKDCSSSIPYKFEIKKNNNEYFVKDSRTPRDGSYYVKDMKAIFPSSVRNDMDRVHSDGTIKRLQLDIQKQVKSYFYK